MPEVDGIQATRDITAADDLRGVKIIVLTTFETDELIVDALRAGASGYLGKGVEPQNLLDAIRGVAAGDSLLSPAATRALIGRVSPSPAHQPTPSTRSPASRLASRRCSPSSARTVQRRDRGTAGHQPGHRQDPRERTMMKLSARDRAQLVVIAYETGLITPGRKPG